MIDNRIIKKAYIHTPEDRSVGIFGHTFEADIDVFLSDIEGGVCCGLEEIREALQICYEAWNGPPCVVEFDFEREKWLKEEEEQFKHLKEDSL